MPAPAACTVSAIQHARENAQSAGLQDPSAAWRLLRPYIALHCLKILSPLHASSLATARAYAWLLNDAFVYWQKLPFEAPERYDDLLSSEEHPACYALLVPLVDEDVHPRKWLSPALQRALLTNMDACARLVLRSNAPGITQTSGRLTTVRRTRSRAVPATLPLASRSTPGPV